MTLAVESDGPDVALLRDDNGDKDENEERTRVVKKGEEETRSQEEQPETLDPTEQESRDPMIDDSMTTVSGDQQEDRFVEIEELAPSPQDEVSSRPKPLAWAPTTPFCVAILIPLLTIFTHALFLHGQTAPMWRLTQIQSIDAWANATGQTTRVTFDALGIEKELHLVRDENSTVQTFTYSFAIVELWEAKGMPGTTMPRIAAIFLVLFSGLWPHIKLILLNLTWLLMRNPERRTKTLHWLSCLGKWSLADILVVCVMVGVLHIDWIVDPGAIKDGVSQNLPEMLGLIHSQWEAVDLCTHFLHFDCAHPAKAGRIVKCRLCVDTVKTAFGYPNWAGSTGKAIMDGISTSGGGSVSLRVVGMSGIYTFCCAVVLSILLSFVVDMLDMRARKAEERLIPYSELLLRDEPNDVEASQEGEPNSRYALMQDESGADPLISPSTLQFHLQLDAGSVMEEAGVGIRLSFPFLAICHAAASFLVLLLSFFAVSWVVFQRQVHGAIPSLIHDILAMEWTRSYSLITLAQDTGAAGGWDYLLMSTFGLFIVFGPLLRSALCVVCHLMPNRLKTLQTLIDLIGAFCAWEVLFLAVIMICLLMPSITGTIIQDNRCAQLDETGNCFQVEFDVMKSFALIIVCGIALVVVSNSFSFFRKKA